MSAERTRARENSSRWMQGARWADGLYIPGRPGRRAASLLIGPDHLVVSARGHVGRLSWPTSQVWTDGYVDGGWTVAEWSAGRGPIGVGLRVTGVHVEATADVRRQLRAVRSAVERFGQGGTVVPLYALGRTSSAADDDRYLLDLLCRTLAERPNARDRLRDPACIDRLLSDIHATPHGPLPFVMGAKRRTIEILQALRSLGFEHPEGGRPMPGESVVGADEVVPAVVRKLEASPFVEGTVDLAAVAQVVRRHYTDIPAWPLGALLT